MVTLMEASNRRFGKTRINLLSGARPRVGDMMTLPSESAIYNELTGYTPAFDPDRLDRRWLDAVGKKPVMFEAQPW